jgi:hypothetical protein
MDKPRRRPPYEEPSEEEGGEYQVAPTDPALEDRWPGWLPREPAPEDETEPPAEPFQFSLGELMGLVLFVAILLSLITSVPGGLAKALAALFGVAVFLSRVAMDFTAGARPIVRIGWWVALGTYLVACTVAVIRG